MASSGRAIQYTIPPREDFNKLTDEQKTRISEAVCPHTAPSHKPKLTPPKFRPLQLQQRRPPLLQKFRFVLRALGFELPKPQTFELLIRHGQKPSNWPLDQECRPIYRFFNLPTSQAIAGTLIRQRDPKEELRRAFRLFDIDGKGIITQEDLRRVCSQVGNNILDADIVAMIEEFDASGKGGVDEDEFLRLMK